MYQLSDVPAPKLLLQKEIASCLTEYISHSPAQIACTVLQQHIPLYNPFQIPDQAVQDSPNIFDHFQDVEPQNIDLRRRLSTISRIRFRICCHEI